tara:strand:+ start:628 stop:927 length:300 start_codon:yes stop_codon:yes gene_type:complete
MLSPRNDAEIIAEEGDVRLIMYGSTKETGPRHILSQENRELLGVDISIEGYYIAVIELLKGAKTVRIYEFPYDSWKDVNHYRKILPGRLAAIKLANGLP